MRNRDREPRPVDALISVSNSSSDEGTADQRSTLNRLTRQGPANNGQGARLTEEPSFELQTGNTVNNSGTNSKEV